jgi:hypothetical protein
MTTKKVKKANSKNIIDEKLKNQIEELDLDNIDVDLL